MYRFILTVITLGLAFEALAAIPNRTREPYLGAIVVDADTREILFEDRADEPVYPASTLKMMTLLLALEAIQQGQLRYDTPVPVSKAAQGMGGSQVHLGVGEVFTLDQMLYALMIQSANDAAVAIAERIYGSTDRFIAMMNRRAAQIGMPATRFRSVHGLPPSADQEPDLTTARDFAALALALIQTPDALRFTSAVRHTFRPDTPEPLIMVNHNALLQDGTGVDGLKTGFIRAGGFSIVATALREGRRVVAVVMGSPSKESRNTATRTLLDRGFASLHPLPPTPPPAPPVVTNPPAAAAVSTEPAVTTSNPAGRWWLIASGTVALLMAGFAAWRLRRPRSSEKTARGCGPSLMP